MTNKLLTLAVPTYNMEKYLSRCLDSVLCENQDYLEVLVVNDGSKDRSSEIGHEYAAKYPDVIRVIDKENGNYGSCVNRALSEAKGKYFRMLDADDWFETLALNQLIEKLKTCDVDMVLTIAEDRDEDNQLLHLLDAPQSVVSDRVYEIADFDGLKLGYQYLFCSHIITYKTSVLRAVGLRLQHGISYTDNEYVFFPLDHARSVVYFDLPLYQYFVGREGQTTQPDVIFRHADQLLQVFTRLYDYYNENKHNQIDAVLHNQQILLTEMLAWVYSPILNIPITDEKKERLAQLELLVKGDTSLYNMTGKRYRMLRFYRKTGLLPDSPVAIVYQKGYRLLRALFK